MTEEHPPAADAPTPDEARLFEFLERYVDSLHSGDLDSRSVIIERHPELSEWIRCIELLDRLAPERDTVPWGEAGPSGEAGPGLATPQPFGKYELLEEIGRGGMGVVFRARQTDLDRLVAIKMILASRLASPDDVGRFHAEARAAGSLRHPNIVAIHDAGEVHGQHFFAMDYVEGRSLAQALAEGPFSPRQAAQCLAAIGKAVDYLHAHHIIHRDLKPSNILLAPDGTPFVTDFGLAKALAFDSPHTQTGAMVGTLGYMAPEQALGETAKATSDVYSLGAILFELLTGRPPFKNASPFDTLVQVIEEDPPRPRKLKRDVPLALEWICLKCLEKQPRNRYASAAALVDDLERFLRGDPLLSAAPGPVRSIIRWGRREPALASHLGALAVSVLILQLKYMVSGSDPPYHLMVMSVFAAWGLTAVACCWLMRRLKLPDIVQYAWAAFDAGFLTLLLYVTPPEPGQAGAGPLLVGYPLLIVAAGLFFRVRLVTFMTIACLVSFGVLVAVGREPVIRPQYTLIYAAALGVIGFVVGYQAYRVRILSGYFEKEDGAHAEKSEARMTKEARMTE